MLRVVPLAVDPEALFAAGSAVVAAGDGVAANLTVLTAGFAAHTGLDAAGTVFGLQYQSAAESLLKAAAAAINACRFSGARIELGASNYSKAEAASTLGGGGGVLAPPGEPVKISAPGPPGTLGAGEPPPPLWALVQSFVDDVWPDGDVAGLHAAAGRWRSFGAALCGMQGALNASKSLVGAQQIAEGDKVMQVLSQIGDSANSIGAECGKLASTLDNFANEVSRAQNAIRDLLHRLGSLADIGHDVALIFEGKALDELEQIARDINDVLHNFGREARAFEQGMKLGMQAIDGWVVGMEKYMRGEFKHFLGDAVGNQVANAFDTWTNFSEGTFKGLVGMVQGIEELDPRWFLIDPKGAAATWMGMTKTGLLNHFLNPQEAVEADKQMFRSLLHLDDWRADRPGLGLGENAFDVVTLIGGGGAVGAGAKGAGAAARGAEESAEAADAAGAAGRAGEVAAAAGELDEIGTAGGGLTKDLATVTGDMPTAEPPVSGAPVALPTDTLPEVPVESTTHPVDTAGGAHESAAGPADAAQAPASAPGPGSAGEPAPPSAGSPHDPGSPPGGGAPDAPTTPSEHLPSTNPRGAEPVPAAHEPVSPPDGVRQPDSVPAEDGHDPASPAANAPHDPVSAPSDGPREPVATPAEGAREPAHAPAEPPRDPAPAPVGAASAPASAAMPGERLVPITPHPAEPVAVRAPASPSGSPVEPAPAAAHTPPSAPAAAPSAPHASAPASPPTGGRPAELPAPHDGGPGGGHRGRPPHSRGPHGRGDDDPRGANRHGSRSHDGKPHGHGDRGADHGGGADGGDPTAAIDVLSSDDLSAFTDYTGAGYLDLNEALRSNALDASQYARVEALNNALGKLPAYEGPVVRGTNLPSEVLAQYQPDEYIIEKAFLSTTRDPVVAQSSAFAGNVEFRIMSFTGRDVSQVSTFPGEQEVLFRSHTRFLVISRITDPLTGRTIIEMIED